MTKELNRRIDGFWNNQKISGNTGLGVVLQAVIHWADHGDHRPLSRFFRKAEAYTADFRTFSLIVRAAVPGAKRRKDAKHEEVFLFEHDGKVRFSNDFGRLVDLFDSGASFRGEDVKAIISPKKDKGDQDMSAEEAAKAGKAAAKRLLSKHGNIAAFIKAFEAEIKASRA